MFDTAAGTICICCNRFAPLWYEEHRAGPETARKQRRGHAPAHDSLRRSTSTHNERQYRKMFLRAKGFVESTGSHEVPEHRRSSAMDVSKQNGPRFASGSRSPRHAEARRRETSGLDTRSRISL